MATSRIIRLLDDSAGIGGGLPTPAESDPDEPIYESGVDTVVDPFDAMTYASTAALDSAYIFSPSSSPQIVMDTNFAGTGTRAARFNYPEAVGCSDADYLIERNFGSSGNHEVLVHQFDVAFSEGWDYRSQAECGAGGDHKIYISFSASGGGRLTVGYSNRAAIYSDGSGNETTVSNNYNPSAGAPGWYITIAGPSGGLANYATRAKQHMNWATTTPPNLTPETLHRVTVRLQRETVTNLGDGRIDMWVAGTKVMELDGTDPSDPFYQHVHVKRINLVGHQYPTVCNAGAGQAQSIWFKNVVVFSPA